MRNIRDAVSSPDGIWAATTGGLLHRDPSQDRFIQYTSLDGLSSNVTSAVAVDSKERVWIAQENGLIDLFDIQRKTFDVIKDLQGLVINDFFIIGDSIYIASSIGISLYLTDRNEIKETYKNLGNFDPQSEVQSIFVDSSEIWVATAQGIAMASLNFPNLQSPQGWTNYTNNSGLPSNAVRGFTRFRGNIIAAVANQVMEFDTSTTTWKSITGNIDNVQILQLEAAQDTSGTPVLYAVANNGLYSSSSPPIWNAIGPKIGNVTGIVIHDNSQIWISTGNAGFYKYENESNRWLPREPDGPATNNITSVALDQQGNLWCTSGDNDNTIAFMVYDGQRWRKYRREDNPFNSNDCRYVTVLQNGERWIGTWGGGIIVANGDNLDDLQFSQFNATGGILSGVDENPNFVVARFLQEDGAGNTWVCNWDATNFKAIAVHSPSNEWQYFSIADGLSSRSVLTVAIEKTFSFDRIWVGTDNRGVRVIDYNGTLHNKFDDNLSGELDADDNLLSTRVRTIVQDREGFMWLGTDMGLNFWFGGSVGSRFGLISDNIQTITVDSSNNKWIGTSSGISVLSGDDNFSLTHITIENSKLVANFIS